MVERASDGTMRRTAGRSLSSGRCGVGVVMVFVGVCVVSGVGVLVIVMNEMMMVLGVGNIALYAGAYTAFKRVYFLNTWVGVVVGVIFLFMGWVVVNEFGMLDLGVFVLVLVLYLW